MSTEMNRGPSRTPAMRDTRAPNDRWALKGSSPEAANITGGVVRGRQLETGRAVSYFF